ncbi:hypothetical protein PG984_007004 [Apiospora sp. TS-2023a]
MAGPLLLPLCRIRGEAARKARRLGSASLARGKRRRGHRLHSGHGPPSSRGKRARNLSPGPIGTPELGEALHRPGGRKHCRTGDFAELISNAVEMSPAAAARCREVVRMRRASASGGGWVRYAIGSQGRASLSWFPQ